MTDSDEVGRISTLLGRMSSGEPGVLGLLFEVAYSELCALARARIRTRGSQAGDGLETAGLVHEVFLRLAQRGDLQARHRGHFFSYAGRVMRSVIIDSLRERMALRRGGGSPHAALTSEQQALGRHGGEQILRVQGALAELAQCDPQLAEIVEMRFFGGMTDAEIAQTLGVTDRTVRRRWEKARPLLLASLRTG